MGLINKMLINIFYYEMYNVIAIQVILDKW